MAKRQDDSRDLDLSIFGQGFGEKFRGTPGNDRIVGTNASEKFRIEQGGVDHIRADGGKDVIYLGANLTAEDRINGGKAIDTIVLEGDYSSGLTLQTETISRIEKMQLRGDFDYAITFAADMRDDKGYISIDATAAQSVQLDGSAMDIALFASGSIGDDVVVGGSGFDVFRLGAGFDMMTGGAGIDSFGFDFTSDSLPSMPDVIMDFEGDVVYLAEIDGDTEKRGN